MTNNIKSLLNTHLTARTKILAYFQCPERWTIYPLQDCTGFEWAIFNDKLIIGRRHGDSIHDEAHATDMHIMDGPYTRDNLTLILVDTGTDSNEVFSVFDNSKRIVNFLGCWFEA
jgi:hypothetical protein